MERKTTTGTEARVILGVVGNGRKPVGSGQNHPDGRNLAPLTLHLNLADGPFNNVNDVHAIQMSVGKVMSGGNIQGIKDSHKYPLKVSLKS